MIDRDGTTVECVSPAEAAYHAGISKGPQGDGVNEYSIGVSFVNRNDGEDPFTKPQLTSAEQLAIDLRSKFSNLRYVTTHAAVSPERKNDPLGFPLNEVASAVNLSVWL